MLYPTLNPNSKSKDFIDVFGGYNHNLRINENEFYDMKNMTSSHYPLIATRDKRGLAPAAIEYDNRIVGMTYKSALYYATIKVVGTSVIDGTLTLHKYDGNEHEKVKRFNDMPINTIQKRQIVITGAYAVIFPDKVYVNLLNPDEDYGTIDEEVTYVTEENGQRILIAATTSDGGSVILKYAGDKEPAGVKNGDTWIDTSGEMPVLKKYSSSSLSWLPVILEGYSISVLNTTGNAHFNEGDYITIENAPDGYNGVHLLKKSRTIGHNHHYLFDGLFTAQDSFSVFTPVIGYGDSNKIRVFCNKNTSSDVYSGKKFMLRDTELTCTENTAAKKYEYWVNRNYTVSNYQADYFITPETKQEVTKTTSGMIWYKFKVKLRTDGSFNESVVERTGDDPDVLYVRIGSSNTGLDNVFIYRHEANVTENTDEISLSPLNHSPIPYDTTTGKYYMPANTKIYPIELGDPMGLYESTFTFNKTVNWKNDKLCLVPEFQFYIENGSAVKLSRKMPDVDYVIESKNRLWGCKYGENNNGDFVNEIYASKLGDFKNWQSFQGISTDSYAASCGSDGRWTGAVDYLGQPIFFKENYIHTVYGSVPSQFSIQSVAARGVQDGSDGSLSIINEVLYYLSPDGVCSYNGSLPSNISYALGDERFSNARATGYKGRYYINMDKADGESVLMVYDTKRQLWTKEDDLSTYIMCPVENDIYYVDDSYFILRSLFGSGGKTDEKTPWFLETGEYGLSVTDNKYVSKVEIRLSLEKGANMIVAIQYDSSGIWERLCNIVRQDISSFKLPIKPRRCDHFKIMLEGSGNAKIYSISKTIEQGENV